ncbi:MAG: hypothetical protein ACJZ9F_08810 [Rhodospirillaceae bacterium]
MRIIKAVLLLVTFSLALANANANADSEDVTECDVLASHGSDPERVAPGVSQVSMDRSAAIDACLKAMKEQPNNRRIRYLLGRAYFYDGQSDEAMPHLVFSAEAGHRQAQFVLGYIYDGGLQGIEQDRCKAESLWLRSARQGRFAALVSYPHHIVRGLFDVCDVQVSYVEIADFLEMAKSMASDYYQRIWTADVTADFKKYKMEIQ